MNWASRYELGQPVHHSVAPFRSFNLAADDFTHLPVKINQGGIDIPKGSLTGGGDELDYLRECGFFFCGSETMRIGLGWQG